MSNPPQRKSHPRMNRFVISVAFVRFARLVMWGYAVNQSKEMEGEVEILRSATSSSYWFTNL